METSPEKSQPVTRERRKSVLESVKSFFAGLRKKTEQEENKKPFNAKEKWKKAKSIVKTIVLLKAL